MKTFTVVTLGCKVNQYDGQLIREDLLAAGYGAAAPGAAADLCVVNTCAVTGAGEAKSRRAVARAVREHPSATVIVTGCCADYDPAAFAAIPGVARVAGNRLKRRIARIAGAGARPDGAAAVSGLEGRTRAFIKVQDGCDAACGYCVVPLVRGRPRSRPPEEILGEAAVLASRGHAEIVLCGIRLGRYGRDRGEEGALARLIGGLERIGPLARIRLSSIEPADIDGALLSRMAAGGKLCPHLHLPLQSGDAGVLEAMNRGYSPGDFRELVRRVRRLVPDASLTTDVMVGFPGETEEAFGRTVAMVEEAAFARVHIFSYSPRRGTAAWRLGDPVPPAAKERRRAVLGEAARRTAAAWRSRFIGGRVELLVQGPRARRPGLWWGLTREYLPLFFPGERCAKGTIRAAVVEGARDDGLYGRLA
ncbi:MAG: tRNA (N(6)-L-threonylcarbamoyladenosine(37)-C(2))-methylthiotransferase MtaB [bacterium]|nr:tRNA (N(6)-L-threonylcarbamoyladenosine(37)-C(2))-methylthiotransferase MtaB [bacterium]